MASRDGDSDIGDRKGKKREKKRENEKREKRERREREHANLQHRKKLVQELLESERAHVAALNTVVGCVLSDSISASHGICSIGHSVFATVGTVQPSSSSHVHDKRNIL